MTIIAFKDGIMAADSAGFVGSVRVKVGRPKIRRGADGSLYGFAGATSVINLCADWLMRADYPHGKPDLATIPGLEDSDFEGLIVRPSGHVERIGFVLSPYVVDGKAVVIGNDTAACVAIGAMHMGASAAQAVEAAIAHTIYVGGPVQVERLGSLTRVEWVR